MHTQAPKAFKLNKRGGRDWNTPLHLAVVNGYHSIAEALVQNGADLFVCNADNKIPIDLCMRDSLIYKLLKVYEDRRVRT